MFQVARLLRGAYGVGVPVLTKKKRTAGKPLSKAPPP